MRVLFAENLRRFRTAKGLSQRELAEKIYVTRSTVAHWENGCRLPDAMMIYRSAQCLDTDVNALLSAALKSEDAPNAIITGFTRPSEAIEYAKINLIALAFLDIEMGKTNGLDLCRELLTINPRTNVVFLTAYVEYSFDAWNTGACGFTLKSITKEALTDLLVWENPNLIIFERIAIGLEYFSFPAVACFHGLPAVLVR